MAATDIPKLEGRMRVHPVTMVRTFTVALCAVATSASLCTGAVAAPTAHDLRPQTRKDLDAAMGGEAFAHASYMHFAVQASRERLPKVSRLYQRTARVELGEHFAEEAALRGTVGTDAVNLRNAIAGEAYEARWMYPAFARQARKDGDVKAAALFHEIAKDEAAHLRRFKAALAAVSGGHGRIPAPPKTEPVAVRPGPPRVSSPRTKANLDRALRGEALAHARYALYARHADRGGRPALARLFHGTAMVELHEHFAGEAGLAGLVRTTRVNLKKTITGERYEARTMYPRFAERAAAVGDREAARLFRHNAKDEAAHARGFKAALDHPR